ncbi:MAG: PKD domain-containing protein, partial [Flavobacteriales bacterium]|nr:PKD domain-containing protein [Flavobacteriales bacterium]
MDSVTATVNEPLLLTGNADTIVGVSCFGLSDGSLTISVSGGTPQYSYLWDAAAGNQTTATATGLIAGSYSYAITDSNGCIALDSATVPEPLELTMSISSEAALCNGDSNGTATAVPAGGTPSYTYAWNTSPAQTSDVATGLPFGTWAVTVTDSNSCTIDTMVDVLEPLAMSLNIVGVNDSVCNGTTDGELDAQVAGGVVPYAYSWSPGASSTATLDNIGAGDYIVVVTDSNNCQISDTATIIELTPLVLDLDDNGMDTVCYDSLNILDAQVSGSAPPYTYSWTDGTISTTGNPISTFPDSGQIWTVTVEDSAGCEAFDTLKYYVNYLQVVVTSTDTVCYGDLTTVTAVVTGTLPGFNQPYTYEWNAGQTTSSFTMDIFTTTNFMVTVTDGCSKQDTSSKVVNLFTFPTIGIKTTSPACPGEPISFTDSVNSVPGATHFWDFGDGSTADGLNVQHTYVTDGLFYPSLTVTTPLGCARTLVSNIPV